MAFDQMGERAERQENLQLASQERYHKDCFNLAVLSVNRELLCGCLFVQRSAVAQDRSAARGQNHHGFPVILLQLAPSNTTRSIPSQCNIHALKNAIPALIAKYIGGGTNPIYVRHPAGG